MKKYIFFALLSLYTCFDLENMLRKIDIAFDKVINESYSYERSNSVNVTIINLLNNYLNVISKNAEYQYNICIKYQCTSNTYSEEFYKKILEVIEKIYDKEMFSTDIEQTKNLELRKLGVDGIIDFFTDNAFFRSLTDLKDYIMKLLNTTILDLNDLRKLFNTTILDIGEIRETLNKYSYNFSSHILQLNDTQIDMTEVWGSVTSAFTSKIKMCIIVISSVLLLIILFYILKFIAYVKICCNKKNSNIIEKNSY